MNLYITRTPDSQPTVPGHLLILKLYNYSLELSNRINGTEDSSNFKSGIGRESKKIIR